MEPTDTKDPQQKSSGVVMADIPSAASAPPTPPPQTPSANLGTSFGAPSIKPISSFAENQPSPSSPPASNYSPQETVVVTGPNAKENPFIPKGVVSEPISTGVVTSPPPASGGGFLRRLLMIIVLLLVLGGLGAGGWWAYQFFMGEKEVTLTYWGLWENDAIIKPAIDTFEASHPKIKIQYIKQSPKQYRERLQSAISRGDGPDIFRFHNTWVAMLRNDLALVPSAVMSASEFSSTFYPVASADLVAGQNIFGIPMEIDGLGLYYNEDLFATAGVTPPATWEDMLTIVPSLTVKNEDTTVVTSALALGTTGNVENFSDILGMMMMQNGAKLTEPTGKEAEEALIFFRKFATPTDPVYTWNDSLDNSIYAFATGKVAMILAPSWRAFDIKQLNPDLRFKVAPVPQLPGNTVTWASYWVEGVSAKSKNQADAWEFVKYLTSKEGVTQVYTEASKTRLFGEPYARVDMASMLGDDPIAGAFVSQAPNAKSFPLASRTFDNGLNDKLIKYLEDAVNSVAQNSEAPQAALETAASGFRQVLSSFGLTSNTAPAQ